MYHVTCDIYATIGCIKCRNHPFHQNTHFKFRFSSFYFDIKFMEISLDGDANGGNDCLHVYYASDFIYHVAPGFGDYIHILSILINAR